MVTTVVANLDTASHCLRIQTMIGMFSHSLEQEVIPFVCYAVLNFTVTISGLCTITLQKSDIRFVRGIHLTHLQGGSPD